MKRISLFFICALFLGSCSQKQDRLRISSWVSSPEERRMFEETLDSFSEAHPDIEFDYEPIPGNYTEKLQLMLGTNTGPDLFFMKGYLFVRLSEYLARPYSLSHIK